MGNMTATQPTKAQTSVDLQALMIERLLAMKPALATRVSAETAGTVTLKSLGLDSLDTLEWAMEIEEAYDVVIETVDFDPNLTLSALSQHLEVLKQKQKQAAQ